MPGEGYYTIYRKHNWVRYRNYRNNDPWLWKCWYCGLKASDDYAEKIGLDKLDLVDPCKATLRKGNGNE